MDEINNMDVAYGMVTDVKRIKSTGVTRIEIEIPAEAHVKAVNLLIDKGVILLPMWQHDRIMVPYGVRKMGQFLGTLAANDAPNEPTRISKIVPRPGAAGDSSQAPMSSGLGSAPRHDMVKQAGTICRGNEVFWRFLAQKTGNEVISEEDAVMALKMLLQIASRADLHHNLAAQREFAALLREFNLTAPALVP